MRAVAIADDRTLQVVDLAEPRLEPHEVRIAVEYCGICGSDLHMYRHVPVGTVMGHEFAGKISEAGGEVDGWKVGDRVIANPFDPCGECAVCRAGLRHLCAQGAARGIGLGRRYGAYAESVVAPARCLIALPDTVSMEHGALAEPVAVGIHGVVISELEPDDPTVVLGAGPIGITTALALRARGFENVVVVELNEKRRHAMASMGFRVSDGAEDHAETLALLGQTPTGVLDCTGHPQGVVSAANLLGPRGSITVIGIPSEPSPLHMAVVAIKELVIRGVLGYTDADFNEAIALISTGAIPADAMITSVVPLDAANERFDNLLSGATAEIKVLLKP